jgi:hypothetical protein
MGKIDSRGILWLPGLCFLFGAIGENGILDLYVCLSV